MYNEIDLPLYFTVIHCRAIATGIVFSVNFVKVCGESDLQSSVSDPAQKSNDTLFWMM
jgi:hypothetical protein